MCELSDLLSEYTILFVEVFVVIFRCCHQVLHFFRNHGLVIKLLLHLTKLLLVLFLGVIKLLGGIMEFLLVLLLGLIKFLLILLCGIIKFLLVDEGEDQ